MEITEVRIKLTEDSDDRLQAFCSITFDDCFVVRDLKIIEGSNGPFVAMPSRKLTAHCPKCGSKNHLRANHCNQCGARQNSDRAVRDHDGRAKLYADIAHPINSSCREMIQQRVITEFQTELKLSQEPGYISRYEDDYENEFLPSEILGEQTAAMPDEVANDTQNEPAEDETISQEIQPEKTETPSEARATEIQPAVSEPRPPHSAAGRADDAKSKSATPSRSQKNSAEKREFGAGIFDD